MGWQGTCCRKEVTVVERSKLWQSSCEEASEWETEGIKGEGEGEGANDQWSHT